MYTKKSGRISFKSNRRPTYRRSSNSYSNGKPRNKGNLTQQYNKYLKLAKEASSSGDRVQSEYYYQFTDHYYRLMIELGINVEENEFNLENKTDQTKNEDINLNDSAKLTSKEDETNEVEKETDTKEENLESIESIPFIAEPAKKKRARTPK